MTNTCTVYVIDSVHIPIGFETEKSCPFGEVVCVPFFLCHLGLNTPLNRGKFDIERSYNGHYCKKKTDATKDAVDSRANE